MEITGPLQGVKWQGFFTDGQTCIFRVAGSLPSLERGIRNFRLASSSMAFTNYKSKLLLHSGWPRLPLVSLGVKFHAQANAVQADVTFVIFRSDSHPFGTNILQVGLRLHALCKVTKGVSFRNSWLLCAAESTKLCHLLLPGKAKKCRVKTEMFKIGQVGIVTHGT